MSLVRLSKALWDSLTAGWEPERRAAFSQAVDAEIDDAGRIEQARLIALASATRLVESEPSEDKAYATYLAVLGVEVEPPSAEEVAQRRQHEAAQRRFAAEEESEARTLAQRERDELAAVDAGGSRDAAAVGSAR